MALSDEKIQLYTRRLLLSRMRIMCNYSFYGLLLMHMRFGVDEEVETAYTDGVRIVFGTGFLDGISDSELDFVMLHEIMHVVLSHCFRGEKKDGEIFNIACDIVVNSNILLENNMNLKSITLKKYGESMHLTPDKKEGHEFTAEQVYEMLIKDGNGDKKNGSGKGKRNSKSSGDSSSENSSGDSSSENSSGGSSSSDASEAEKSGKNSKTSQGGDASKADEDTNARASQNGNESKTGADKNAKPSQDGKNGNTKAVGDWDDHSKWGKSGEDPELLHDVWISRVTNAAAAIEIRDATNGRGTLPLLAQRVLQELKRPKIDWRTILSEFIHEEIVDYSFSPPDRRFDDTPFFLPDFNETEETVKKILFMIDTSGSMSDKMVTSAYSEVKGAIDQFDGKLAGWLGFFDGAVAEPQPFENEEEFKVIHPTGGGGTDFNVIFKYVEDKMQEDLPASIIILTDGYAPFPPQKAANGIPVLWLVNNDAINPPWGKVARIIDTD